MSAEQNEDLIELLTIERQAKINSAKNRTVKRVGDQIPFASHQALGELIQDLTSGIEIGSLMDKHSKKRIINTASRAFWALALQSDTRRVFENLNQKQRPARPEEFEVKFFESDEKLEDDISIPQLVEIDNAESSSLSGSEISQYVTILMKQSDPDGFDRRYTNLRINTALEIAKTMVPELTFAEQFTMTDRAFSVFIRGERVSFRLPTIVSGIGIRWESKPQCEPYIAFAVAPLVA